MALGYNRSLDIRFMTEVVMAIRKFIVLICLFSTLVHAGDHPWHAATEKELLGVWRQVSVKLLTSGQDATLPWYHAKQYFGFRKNGGFKHLLVNPDNEPDRLDPNPFQMQMITQMPTTQTIQWKQPGIAFLKHPERPLQRMDMAIYDKATPPGPGGITVTARKGDLIIVFYDYKDINLARYVRLLRPVGSE
jgi:hypothetical protein